MAMLPSAYAQPVSLAAVLTSCLAAIERRTPVLDIPSVDRAVVVLVDGLGAIPLKARAGHARTLASRLNKGTTIESGFPTTTAAALTTLTTGALPGRHGMVGYQVLDPARRTVFNQLSGWGTSPDPQAWQPLPTVFEQARDAGVPAHVIAPERYRHSQLTHAILRGGEYHGADGIEERVAAAQGILRAGGRSLSYLYIPELDMAGHEFGSESERWTAWLERIDATVATLAAGLRPGEGVFVTADHGVLDVPERAQLLFDRDPALVEGVELVAGEPRCLQLHLAPGASAAELEAVASRWRDAEGERSWIATRAEAVAAGWFGPEVDARVLPRIGDVLVAARARVVYYDARTAKPRSLAMVGQHGSFSPEEVKVPLIGFGAFAR